MKHRIAFFILAAASLAMPALAQTSSATPLPLPPAVEKELAAKASNVTEVTLDKNMLGFAAKFMSNNKSDSAATQQLIQGLDGIYVRNYEFDKEGAYSMDDVEKLRKAFETAEWMPIVRSQEKKSGEISDVMIKMVNGESRGMFILSAERRELSIVLILGPIRMDQLGGLSGLSGLGALGDVTNGVKNKDKKGGGE